MASAVALLAHQGGWDEVLMVLAPLVVVGLFLLKANQRASGLGGSRHQGLHKGNTAPDRAPSPDPTVDDR